MDNKKLMLMLGALVIALGTALAARSMLAGNATPTVQAALPMVAPKGPRVLVAQRALPPGTIITADAISFQEWPNSLVRDAYFQDGKIDMNKLLGTVVRYPITAGQPLTTGALVSPGDRGFLAAALAPGMRAITITVSAKTGVGGFVFPGDRVDVMLTQSINGSGQMGAQNFTATETVLRNVRVLATDQSTDSEQVNGKTVVRNSQTVTVEVTPKVAEKIEVAQQVGTLSLSLRALADNAADLDRAIAKGQVQIDGTPGKGAAAFAAPRSNDSGTSVTTGAEVSRFQRASLPPAAPVAGPVAAPRSADGAAPAHNDHGVRVMRGRDSQSVTQSTLGLLGRGDGAGQVSAAAPGTSSASAGASQN